MVKRNEILSRFVLVLLLILILVLQYSSYSFQPYIFKEQHQIDRHQLEYFLSSKGKHSEKAIC